MRMTYIWLQPRRLQIVPGVITASGGSFSSWGGEGAGLATGGAKGATGLVDGGADDDGTDGAGVGAFFGSACMFNE